MDALTIFIIVCFTISGLSFLSVIYRKAKPAKGQLIFVSSRNNLSFSLFREDKCLNTYMTDYGSAVSLILPPASYRCEYSATSGEAGTVMIDLKNQDRIKIILPPSS